MSQGKKKYIYIILSNVGQTQPGQVEDQGVQGFFGKTLLLHYNSPAGPSRGPSWCFGDSGMSVSEPGVKQMGKRVRSPER